ncbi:hypothetical protein EYS14_01125 [Alteromonadaceae bacterium M269]|nr:hypothetical protein EYS14_01125 [Alteromonadaceae bacterium M269]
MIRLQNNNHRSWKLLSILLLLCAFLASPYALSSSQKAYTGKRYFTFSNWQGPALKVWTFIPKSFTPNSPIVFVMHGTNRDGERYRNEWVELAKAYNLIIVVPEFPKKQFAKAINYNLGNIFQTEQGGENPRELWSFSAIEPIFDQIKARYSNNSSGYGIYGHSAGGQFVHRYNYFVPNARITRAISANAGWYTLPTTGQDFPYGLKGAPIKNEDIAHAFETDLIVLLGTKDTNTKSRNLRKTKEAKAQGPHRFARGKYYYQFAKSMAESNELTFNWKIKFAPDVGHKNGLMANFAAPLFAETAQN